MARIPQYFHSSKGPRAQTMGHRINPNALDSGHRALANAGRQVEQFGNQLYQHALDIQKADDRRALIEAQNARNEHSQKFLETADSQNMPPEKQVAAYEAHMSEFKYENPYMTRDAREQFRQENKLYVRQQSHQVKYQAEARIAKQLYSLNVKQADDYITNEQPEHARMAYEAAVEDKSMSREEAEQRIAQIPHRIDMNRISRDTQENPYETMRKLNERDEAGNYAHYQNLNDEQRITASERAEHTYYRNRLLAYKEISGGIAKGDYPTPQKLEDYKRKGILDDKQIAQLGEASQLKAAQKPLEQKRQLEAYTEKLMSLDFDVLSDKEKDKLLYSGLPLTGKWQKEALALFTEKENPDSRLNSIAFQNGLQMIDRLFSSRADNEPTPIAPIRDADTPWPSAASLKADFLKFAVETEDFTPKSAHQYVRDLLHSIQPLQPIWQQQGQSATQWLEQQLQNGNLEQYASTHDWNILANHFSKMRKWPEEKVDNSLDYEFKKVGETSSLVQKKRNINEDENLEFEASEYWKKLDDHFASKPGDTKSIEPKDPIENETFTQSESLEHLHKIADHYLPKAQEVSTIEEHPAYDGSKKVHEIDPARTFKKGQIPEGLKEGLAEFKDIIEIGEIDIEKNIREASEMSLFAFVNGVKSGAKWDYKQKLKDKGFDPDLLQRFGNFHFGMMAQAKGFKLPEAVVGAALYQVVAQPGGHPVDFAGAMALYLSRPFLMPQKQVTEIYQDLAKRGFTFGDNKGDALDIVKGWTLMEEAFKKQSGKYE